MREVEFLPDWYPKVRARKRMVAIQTWGTLAIICALGLWTICVQRKVHAREAEIKSLGADLTQSVSEVQRLDDLLALQKELGKQDDIFARIGRPVETTRVMTTLEQIMPKEMALLDLSMELADSSKAAPGNSLSSRAKMELHNSLETRLNFKLHGVSPTDMQLSEFLVKMTARPFFKNVDLLYSHDRNDSGHVLREFEIAFVLDLTPGGGR